MFMLRSVMGSVLLFLVFGNLSVSCMAAQREGEERPLLADVPKFKSFTKQQWMEMNPQNEKTQDLMDEAAEYYRGRPAELEKLMDSFNPCCLFVYCCSPKMPKALLEIERRIWERRPFSSCVSPQTYVATRGGRNVSSKNQEISRDDEAPLLVETGTGLEIGDLEKTLPNQTAQFELFKTQMQSEMEQLVETEVNHRVEVLTQTMTEQREEIQRLQQEIARFGGIGQAQSQLQEAIETLQRQISETQVGTAVVQDFMDVEGVKSQIETLTQKNAELEDLLRKFTRVVLTLKAMAPGDAYKARYTEKFGQK